MNNPAATRSLPLTDIQRLARHADRMRRGGLTVEQPNDYTVVVSLPAGRSGLVLCTTYAVEGFDVELSQQAPDGTSTLIIQEHSAAVAAMREMN